MSRNRPNVIPYLGSVGVFLCFAILYGLVAYRSPGYDDEITNINLIEHLGLTQTIRLVQLEDVHPPGSYVINGVLYSLLNNWSYVRVFAAILYATSAAWFFFVTQRRLGTASATLAIAVAGLTPATLMWCTGIRWYAYFVPILLWTLTPPRHDSKYWFYIKPALSWLILALIGYAAIVLAPAILLFYFLQKPGRLVHFIKKSSLPWGLAAVVYLPQLLLFLHVQIQYAAGQTGGVTKSVEGIVLSLFSNQGLFPISIFSIISIFGWVLLFLITGRQFTNSNAIQRGFLSYGFSVVLMALSGIAAKFRNLVTVTPFQADFIAQSSRVILGNGVACAAVVLVLLGNLAGIINVATHEDTTKNSWNMPIGQVVQHLDELSRECGSSKLVVYTFDPVLGYTLRRNPNLLVLEYFNSFSHWTFRSSTAACAAIIWTYNGILSDRQYGELKSAAGAIGASSSQTIVLGKDTYAALKRKFDPTFPDFMAEIQFFRRATSLDAINTWASKEMHPFISPTG